MRKGTKVKPEDAGVGRRMAGGSALGLNIRVSFALRKLRWHPACDSDALSWVSY